MYVSVLIVHRALQRRLKVEMELVWVGGGKQPVTCYQFRNCLRIPHTKSLLATANITQDLREFPNSPRHRIRRHRIHLPQFPAHPS
jgi:hypothetical protein